MNQLVQTYITGRSAVKIAADIETAVRAGDLRPDAMLPTVRAMAELLGVSPATVATAYRTLGARGIVVTDGRRGTRIGWQGVVRARPATAAPIGVRDVASGNPDPRLLPSMARALRSIDATPGLYGEPLNLPALVDVVARELATDGVPPGPMVVVSGAMAGIERVLRQSLRPGDRVAVEDPGFSNVFDVAVSLGLTLVPVAIDGEGMRPEALAQALKQRVGAVVMTPRAQNPTGAALTPARAAALRRVLRKAPEVLVIEDDHAALVAGAPAVFVTDGRLPRWTLVRSFSKALNPDLRLAVLTGDAATMQGIEDRMRVAERWVSLILQRLTAELLGDPAVRAELAEAATIYRRRRVALIDALAAYGLHAVGRSGLNVWLPVAEESGLVQSLLAAGWAVAAGERFRLASGPAIRVTTARLEEADALALADAIASALGARGRSAVV